MTSITVLISLLFHIDLAFFPNITMPQPEEISDESASSLTAMIPLVLPVTHNENVAFWGTILYNCQRGERRNQADRSQFRFSCDANTNCLLFSLIIDNFLFSDRL